MTTQQVTNEEELEKAMQEIDDWFIALHERGKTAEDATDEENAELLRVTLLVKEYEDIHYPIPD